MAFRAVRMADVLPRCCPAARMRLLRSVILLRAQSNLRRLPQDFKGERHAVIAKHLPSQSGQEWIDSSTSVFNFCHWAILSIAIESFI